MDNSKIMLNSIQGNQLTGLFEDEAVFIRNRKLYETMTKLPKKNKFRMPRKFKKLYKKMTHEERLKYYRNVINNQILKQIRETKHQLLDKTILPPSYLMSFPAENIIRYTGNIGVSIINPGFIFIDLP